MPIHASTRRAFVGRLAGLAAGAALGPWSLAAAAPAAAVRRPEPGRVEVELTAQAGPVELETGGRPVLWTYDGTLPGPLLRLREGDAVRLRLVNRLPQPTNLHFHGLHIPPDGAADNASLAIPPGERFDYAFTVGPGNAGLHWYHPHVHGIAAGQLFRGLAGPIVVESEADALPELAAADEHILVLKDLALDGDQAAGHAPFDWIGGKEGPLILVDGKRQPVLRAARPLLRLRLVNAANARYFRLRLEDHPLIVLAPDGRFLERPVEQAELLLVPGGRADLVVPLAAPGRFDLVNLPYDRRGRTGHPPQPILTVEVPAGLGAARLPDRLGTVEDLTSPAPAERRRIEMSLFYFDGRPFDHHRVDIRARLGDLEQWEVVNLDTMDHPFHLHTWPFQVLALNGRPEPVRAWRDTVNLRPGDVALLAVPLRSFAGRSLYHCHIAEHGNLSMMGQIEVGA